MMTIKQKTDLRNLMENYYHSKHDLEAARGDGRQSNDTKMKLAVETDSSFMNVVNFIDGLLAAAALASALPEATVDLAKKVHIQFISSRNIKHTGFIVPQRDPNSNRVGKIIICDDEGCSDYNAWDYNIVFFGDSSVVPISTLSAKFGVTITNVEYR